MNGERLNQPDRPDSREPKSRELYLNSIRNRYGFLFADLGFKLRDVVGIPSEDIRVDLIREERARKAITADILTELLALPISHKQRAMEKVVMSDLGINFPSDSLYSQIFDYVNEITHDGEIIPLDVTSEEIPQDIVKVQQELASQITDKNTLPDNIKVLLEQDPSQLPYIMRVYKHCAQQELLDPKNRVTKTKIWMYHSLNPKGIENLPENQLGVTDDPYETLLNPNNLPPINPDQIRKSDRILLVGTPSDTGKLMKSVEEAFQRNFGEFVSSESNHLDSFWSRFFDSYDFLDDIDRRNLPSHIFTTGYIRGYGHGGYIAPIMETLEALSEKYEIQLATPNRKIA